MKGLKDLSIRCSGFVTEAKLRRDMNVEDVAKVLDITDRTLREKSNAKEMYTLPLSKIAMLADLAGYEIDFRRAAK